MPRPHPSLTMMATPENMMAETSCQTLHEREDRGPSMSLEVTPSLTLHKAFLAACSSISLHPSSMHKRDSQKLPMERLSFPHPTSSSLNMQTSLAGATEPDSPSPKQRREVQMVQSRVPTGHTTLSHSRTRAPPAPHSPCSSLHVQ